MTRGIKGDSSIGDKRDRSISDQRETGGTGVIQSTGASVTRGDSSTGDQRGHREASRIPGQPSSGNKAPRRSV